MVEQEQSTETETKIIATTFAVCERNVDPYQNVTETLEYNGDDFSLTKNASYTGIGNESQPCDAKLLLDSDELVPGAAISLKCKRCNRQITLRKLPIQITI